MTTIADKAETALAQLLLASAGKLIDVQQDTQPPDAAAEIVKLVRASAGARIVIELPKCTTGVASTIRVSILDPDGGEADIRVLTMAAPDASATTEVVQ